jgi:hypothetical protein
MDGGILLQYHFCYMQRHEQKAANKSNGKQWEAMGSEWQQ